MTEHDQIIAAMVKHLEKWSKNICCIYTKYQHNVGSETRFEADILRLDNNGFLIEYEIKTSYNDFVNDFLKVDKERKLPSFGKHRSKAEQPRVIHKYEIILSGKRCNKFYYVVSRKIYNKIPNDLKTTYGFIVYDLYEDGSYHFYQWKHSPTFTQLIQLPPQLIRKLCHEYRRKNKSDLNLKDYTEEELYYRCIINHETYSPRLRKQRESKVI